MPKLLKLLLIAAFFNALSWIILIPIWQYPDEQAHFAQVQNLAELGVFPTGQANTSGEIATSEKIFGTARDGFGNNRYTYHPEFNVDYSDTGEGLFENYIESLDKSSRTNLVKKEATHNPPLYYFLGSLFYQVFGWGDLFTRVYAVRVMSAILFIATIFVAYKIATLIFKNKILQIALPTLVAFKPMLVFASTGILPDALTNFLFSLILFFSLKIIKEGLKISTLELIGLTIIFGVLTRQQFLISIPIVSLPIIYQLIKNRQNLAKYVLPIGVTIAAFAALSFFIPQLFYLRSISAPEIDRPNLVLLFSDNFIEYLKISFNQTVSQTLPWYWGVYRWLSYTLPPLVYQIINRVLVVAAIGVLIALARPIVKKKLTDFDKILYFLIVASFIYYAVIIIWDYYFRLDHIFSFGIQGRYFFPLVVAHLVIILMGLRTIYRMVFKKYAKWAIFATVFLMVLFNNVSLFFISASYYSTSSLNSFIIQASQYKPEIFKGNIILFIIIISLTAQIFFTFSFVKFILRENSFGNEKD